MTIFKGRLSDGKAAVSRLVQVRLERALEIEERTLQDYGNTKRETWAFHRLTASAPVLKGSRDVLLHSADHPGETLFIDDPAFAAAILKVSPQLKAGSIRLRHARPWLVLTALVAAIVGGIWALDLSPAKAVARLLPDPVRNAIGERAAEAFTDGHPVCTDPRGTEALARLAARLSAASGTDRPFHVRVVDWDIVNAFALPGEQIVISTGLIDAAETPDEVAGVLAHEMGHGIEYHPEAGIIRAVGVSAGMELVFSGSSSTLGNIGGAVLQLRYSRGAEREADAHAIRILKEAGISVKPLAGFFRRLSALEGSDGDHKTDEDSLTTSAADIFSTHPPTPERIEEVEKVEDYPATPSVTDEDWAAIRHICSEPESGAETEQRSAGLNDGAEVSRGIPPISTDSSDGIDQVPRTEGGKPVEQRDSLLNADLDLDWAPGTGESINELDLDWKPPSIEGSDGLDLDWKPGETETVDDPALDLDWSPGGKLGSIKNPIPTTTP
ncbi:MAG: M48 family metallopeptidase [Hyphomicrobiaceae bacterium]